MSRRRVPRARVPRPVRRHGVRVSLRTCAGCGERAPRDLLRRIALAADGRSLEWRLRGGRGTYLHESAECRRRFVEGRKALLGLRARVDRAERERLVESEAGAA